MPWKLRKRSKPLRDLLPARYEVLGIALFFILASTLFLWPALLGGRVLLPADLVFDLDPLWWPLAPAGYTHPSNPLLTDPVYQFFPWKVFTLRLLARGQIPLWNPYIDAGLPFVGNGQSAVFGPFNLVGYLLPLYPALAITAALRLVVAGTFTFLFAREIGLSRSGGLLAATAFTFSGPMVMWLEHPHSHVIVWLPALLWTTERAIARRSGGYAVASGLVIGAHLLGGHPETSFHVMLAWGAYSLYRAVSLEGWHLPRLLPHLGRMALSALLGLLLAAVQVLPFVEAILGSAVVHRRLGHPSAVPPLNWLLDWHEWPTAITTLLPNFFGTDADGSYWFPYSNYIEQNGYVGVLPLALGLLALLHLLRRSSPTRRAPGSFLAISALFALGIALRLPILNLVNHIPPLSLVANGRMRLLYAFFFALLAGLGLDEIQQGKGRSRRDLLRLLLGLALIALLLTIAAYVGFRLFKEEVIRSGRAFVEANQGNPYLSRPLDYYYALVEERYERKLALYRPTNVVMYLPALIFLLWFAADRWGRRVARRTVWVGAAIGLTLLDLFVVGVGFHPAIEPQDIFPTPEAVRFLQRDTTVYRICGTGLILYPNSNMLFDLPDARGYDPITPRRYAELVDRLEGHYRHHGHSLFIRADSPVLDLLNVKYVLTDQDLEAAWEPVYVDGSGIRIYRNPDVVPRAFVVYRAEVVEGADRSLERLLEEGFDFRRRVVLEERPTNWQPPPTPPASPPVVQIADYQPNRVVLQVETAADGLLVLTDAYAPGWKAFVDGEPTPIYVADHAFRAIVVPTGSHQVEFVYAPMSFRIGAALSLSAGLAVVASLVLRTLRTRRTGRGGR